MSYDQTKRSSVEKEKAKLESYGHRVDLVKYTYKIDREDNKYKKRLKWHMTIKAGNGSTSSHWFTSKNQAIKYLKAPRQATPAGNRFLVAYMEEG